MTKLRLTFLLAFSALACQRETPADGAAGRIVARAAGKQLALGELEGIFPANATPADSADLIRRYAESWARKELLFDEAQKTSLDDRTIDQKVREYRYSLTIYAFEQQYLRQKLDTVVTDAELEKYYAANAGAFTLRQPIVQAALVKLGKAHKELARIQALLGSKDSLRTKELVALCAQFAERYTLNDTLWTDLGQMTAGTPWAADPAPVLLANKLSVATDTTAAYLLRVRAFRLPGQTAPLAFARPQARGMVLSQRKVKLLANLEKALYERAKASKTVVIEPRP